MGPLPGTSASFRRPRGLSKRPDFFSRKSDGLQLPEMEALCWRFPPGTVPLLFDGPGLPAQHLLPGRPSAAPHPMIQRCQCPLRLSRASAPRAPWPPLPHCFLPPPPGGGPRESSDQRSPSELFVLRGFRVHSLNLLCTCPFPPPCKPRGDGGITQTGLAY